MKVHFDGRNLKQTRQDRGFSICYLSALSGVSQSYIRELEGKEQANPSASVVCKLCYCLGITMELLMTET